MLTARSCGKSVTQTAEAEAFLKAHRGHIAFATIDIGGNDASGCIGSGGVNAACVSSSSAAIQTNLFNAQPTQIYANAGFPTADGATSLANDNLAMTGLYNGVRVPQNVANLCNWTLQCSNNDVHANNTGHGKIADAFSSKIDAAPPAITTVSLPSGKIGTPYPTKLTGTFSFQIQVKDSAKPKVTATKSFSIKIT